MASSHLPRAGLSADAMGEILKTFHIPVLLGINKTSHAAIDTNTIFALLADGHWLLCSKGSRSTLVFDSLGLPDEIIKQLLPSIPFTRWNERGYQAERSVVCGYYVLVMALELGRVRDISNGDKFFKFLKYSVPIPESMPDWWRLHQHHIAKLRQNDHDVYNYIRTLYPHIVQADRHSIPGVSDLSHDVFVGSPKFSIAGVHAPSMLQRHYAEMTRNNTSAAPQAVATMIYDIVKRAGEFGNSNVPTISHNAQRILALGPQVLNNPARASELKRAAVDLEEAVANNNPAQEEPAAAIRQQVEAVQARANEAIQNEDSEDSNYFPPPPSPLPQEEEEGYNSENSLPPPPPPRPPTRESVNPSTSRFLPENFRPPPPPGPPRHLPPGSPTRESVNPSTSRFLPENTELANAYKHLKPVNPQSRFDPPPRPPVREIIVDPTLRAIAGRNRMLAQSSDEESDNASDHGSFSGDGVGDMIGNLFEKFPSPFIKIIKHLPAGKIIQTVLGMRPETGKGIYDLLPRHHKDMLRLSLPASDRSNLGIRGFGLKQVPPPGTIQVSAKRNPHHLSSILDLVKNRLEKETF